MMYTRKSYSTLFLLPCIAVGFDENGLVFMELAWFNFAIGVGSKA